MSAGVSHGAKLAAMWDESLSPDWLYPWLGAQASDRKLRLVLCAAVRAASAECGSTLLLRSVETVERFADGAATLRQLSGAEYDADEYVCGPRHKGPAPLPPNAVLLAAATRPPQTFAATPFGLRLSSLWTLPAGEQERLARFIKDIIANPFRVAAFDPTWRTAAVTALARGAYDGRAFDRLPVLADALQEAGCADEGILGHCRGDGPHARGCWAVDLVLGKS